MCVVRPTHDSSKLSPATPSNYHEKHLSHPLMQDRMLLLPYYLSSPVDTLIEYVMNIGNVNVHAKAEKKGSGLAWQLRAVHDY